VCEDEVVLERVDDAGTPVAPDQRAARVLATGLANRTFPFIRYDLGDEVTYLPGQCACGSRFARLANVAGRRDDDFHYPRCTVPAGIFRHVLGIDPRLSEYQVRQTPNGVEVLAVGAPDTAELAASLIAALRRLGLADPQVRIWTVDRIQRNDATGKLSRFIALPDGSRARLWRQWPVLRNSAAGFAVPTMPDRQPATPHGGQHVSPLPRLRPSFLLAGQRRRHRRK
jgi:phenylacetate-CoA ligase